MKNFLIYIVVSSAISITSGLIYAKYSLSPRVKEMIQVKASDLLGSPVQIHDLRVLILPQFSLAATGVKFAMTDPNLKVDIAKLFIAIPINKSLFNRKIPFGPIQIHIEDPKFLIESSPKADKAQGSETQLQTQIKFARDFNVDLKVDRAKVKWTQFTKSGEFENESSIDPLDFEIHIPKLDSDWSFVVKARLNNLQPAVNIPIDLSGELNLKDQVLSVAEAAGAVAGVGFVLSGEQRFFDKVGHWKLYTNTPDFEKLKHPPVIGNLKNWRGGFQAELSATLIPGQDWQFFAKLFAKRLSFELDYQKDQFKAKGPLTIDGDTNFSSLDQLKLDRLKMDVNLDHLEIHDAAVFNKPKDTPLHLALNLSGRGHLLNIFDCSVQFLNMKSSASGIYSVNNKEMSEIRWHIDPFSLSGWEKYISIFSSSQTSGVLSLNSIVRNNPGGNWNFEFNSLKIEKLKATIQYASEAPMIQISGPFELDSELRGTYDSANQNKALSILGSGVFNFQNLKMIQNTEANSRPKEKQIASTEGPFFYWPKFNSSKFKLDAQVAHFNVNSIEAESMTAQINLLEQNLSGQMSLSNTQFATKGFDELLNERLAQIPGVGNVKGPDSSSPGSTLFMKFGVIDSVMSVFDFKLLTAAKNELHAAGNLQLNSQILNLTGTAYLADAPIGGDVKLANADNLGRFTIPYVLSGSLQKPEVSIAPKTIEEVLKKTLLFVAQREANKVKGIFSNLGNAKLPEKLPPKAPSKNSEKQNGQVNNLKSINDNKSNPDDPDDVEDSGIERTVTSKPTENKIEALKNRLHGVFEKHN